MLTLLLLLPLSSTPAKGWEGLPSIPAPLGRIGEVVGPLPQGGLPGGEEIAVVSLEGCAEPRAVGVTRLLSGLALGGNQLWAWLKETGLERRLFRRPGQLAETLDRVRQAVPSRRGACGPLVLEEGWRVATAAVGKKRCATAPTLKPGAPLWLAPPKAPERPAAVVSITPGAQDACRPRLSTAFFDVRGRARLRFHADYGGRLAVELVGDSCTVDFTFDAATQTFRAHPRKGTRCPRLNAQ